MPFAVESEDDLFDFIVYENPQQPDKETMAQLSMSNTWIHSNFSSKFTIARN